MEGSIKVLFIEPLLPFYDSLRERPDLKALVAEVSVTRSKR